MSRIDYPRLFADTTALHRRCGRQLLVLGVIPAAVTGVTVVVLFRLYATTLMTAVVSFNPAGLASGPLAVAAVAWLATMLVTVQCGAVIVQVASQVADGRAPELRVALRATNTVVPRLMLPCLALAAGVWLAAAGGATAVLNALRTARLSVTADRTAAVSTVLALFGTVVLCALACVAIAWWLRVKLFLLLPAASLDRLPGFAPVTRSWQLTRGIAALLFWALVVVGLAEGTAVVVGGQVVGALVTPAPIGGAGGLVSLVSQLMPAVTVGTAIGVVVTTLTWPFLTAMSTLVYRERAGYRLTLLMSG